MVERRRKMTELRREVEETVQGKFWDGGGRETDGDSLEKKG